MVNANSATGLKPDCCTLYSGFGGRHETGVESCEGGVGAPFRLVGSKARIEVNVMRPI